VPSEEQLWERKFRLARSAFEREGADALIALFQAITEAYQVVSICYEQLSRLGPKQLEEPTFNDWQNFLAALNSDTNLNIEPASVRLDMSMQTTLESIKDIARGALLQLQDMNAATPPLRKDREPVLDELEKLKNSLQTARKNLGQLPEVRAANEASADVVRPEPVYVPLVGQIAAGTPILADESIVDIFPLPRRVVGEGTLFLLQVVGDSMLNAAITDGDWVVVRQQNVAENGEIVVAIIDDAVTVKTFRKTPGGHILLVPQNDTYAPIPGDYADILGKVVAVLRKA
jgi:SOS regulatory protein LexA